MKGLKISKELLSEVLKDKLYLLIDKNFTYSIVDNYVLFAEDECVIFEINVYELAYKCKEWAFSKGYTILTYKMKKISEGIWADIIDSTVFKWEDLMISSSRNINLKTIYSLNEPSVIVESCEWILSEINK